MLKVELPAEIDSKMNAWRHGVGEFPEEYIEFHRLLANQELSKLPGLVVHNTLMESDGWMDGMRALVAIVEKDGVTMKLQWHDGNQEFFVKTPAGASPLRQAPAVR